MNNKTCKDCIYCKDTKISSNEGVYKNGRYYSEAYFLFCYRMPQSIEINDDHWCGEFRPRDNQAIETKQQETIVEKNYKIEILFIPHGLSSFLENMRWDNGELAFKEGKFAGIETRKIVFPLLHIIAIYSTNVSRMELVLIDINASEYIPKENAQYKTASTLLYEIEEAIIRNMQIVHDLI